MDGDQESIDDLRQLVESVNRSRGLCIVTREGDVIPLEHGITLKIGRVRPKSRKVEIYLASEGGEPIIVKFPGPASQGKPATG